MGVKFYAFLTFLVFSKSQLLWGHSILLRGQDEGGGGEKMSVFVHAQGMKTVHVVIEWPLSGNQGIGAIYNQGLHPK